MIQETIAGTRYKVIDTFQINEEDYESDLKRRQEEHLARVRGSKTWRPCLHDQCPSCLGTGIRHDGSPCIHGIACPCPKCSPQY